MKEKVHTLNERKNEQIEMKESMDTLNERKIHTLSERKNVHIE